MKFFNSDKSGFLSFVAKRMKALFALFFIIAGTSSVWGQNPELSWTYASDMSGWADAVGKSEYTFIRQDVVFAGNNYTHYLDIEFQSAGTDNYKLIEDGKNWYGMGATIQYQCKWLEWKSSDGNTAFQHNAGRYRMYINAYHDQRRVSVTGIIVTIDQPVKNADGTYTITGSFANANANIEPNGQKVRLCQVEFTQGLTGRYNGKNADNVELISVDAIEQTGETFTVITPALTEGATYTCRAVVVDDKIGDAFSESVTFTAEAATQAPEYSATIVADNSVAEQVSLSSSLTITNGVTVENIGNATCQFSYKAADAADWQNIGGSVAYNNGSAALSEQSLAAGDYVFRATWTLDAVEIASAESATVTINAAGEPQPTVTDLYIFGVNDNWSNPSDEWKCTSVSQDGNVYTWDWPSTPKTFNGGTYFKVGAKNAENTGIDDNNNYGPSGSDATLDFNGVQSIVQTVVNSSQSKAFTVSSATKISKIEFNKSDLTVTFYAPVEAPDPVTPTADSYVVTWAEPVYDAEAGTVVLSATVAAAENAGFALADGTFEAQINVVGLANSARTILSETNQYTISHTISGVAANQQIDYSLQIVTGEGSEIVSPSDVADINPQTYVVEEQGPTDLNLYVRGQNYNGWGYPGEDFKGVTTDGVIYTWDWALAPKEMSGPFKIAYCNINNPDNWNNDLNFGLENAATLNFGADGTWTGTLVKNEFGDMTIDPARNVKKITFKYDTKELLIETETSSSCQDLKNGFTISGQFNVGVSDGGGLYEGTAVESGEADPADGYWSDGARFVQLTADDVPANYFKWECVGYAIDNNTIIETENFPTIAWTDKDKTSARAELSLPGTYTFVCEARCNETDDWTISEELTITAPAPEMGFNGNIVTNHEWGTPEWAGQADGGYMTRRSGSLTWVSNPFTVDGFGTGNLNYHFVIDQRYKFLGCVKQNGWTENNECNDLPGDGNNKDNKINRSNLTFKNVAWDGEQGANFAAINPGAWVANETQLQLVVTMIGWDSYTVALEEVSQECTTPADNFAISAQLNKGAGAPFEGNIVASGSNTATGGYFADGFRTVTLTTTQVADTYEWKLVSYAIDGNAQETADLTALATITNDDAQTATALLSLPGDYTFQCTAACTDGTPVNSATVTISTYPEMGFDGPIGTPASVSENGWNHAWAGQSGNGLLVRENASLKWSLTFVYQGVGSTPNDFVVIQRYKRGCVTAPDGGEQGWAGFTECGAIVPGEPDLWGNKINASIIDLASGLGYASTTEGDNFRANDLAAEQGWVAGETELTLTVTMTGWDSYTVELAKKQKQIFANYSSNDPTMGTVAMKVGDTPIANGKDITAYIGEQVTLTATPAPGYKVASWKINGKVTESNRTTISPTLSGAGLNVVVTFERDCYSGIVYDLTGGGVICANGGSTELSLNTLNNVTYQLYKGGVAYGEVVQGNGEAAKWTISEAGTYTAKSYDSRFAECQAQAIDMNGSADVTTVAAPEITVNPSKDVHLTVLQARSFTADVPVDWSITDVTRNGDYCTGDGYMISSQTDTSLVAKFLCIGTAKITATMKAPNQNCKAEVTVHQNGAEMENCAPEPEDMQ